VGGIAILAVNWFSPDSLLESFGTGGVLAIVFAETGLLLGLLLPGDVLLVAAGAACAGDDPTLSLPLIAAGLPVAAIGGAQTGYWFGRWAGPKLFERRHHAEDLEKGREALERFGAGRAIVICRFIIVLRTVINPVAGAVGIDARRFAFWNLVGGLIWTQSLVWLGYGLGETINVDVIVGPIFGVSLLVIAVRAVTKARRSRGGAATTESAS
jgi:membrane-associated protein